ncbi:MAG: hypothetical protein E6G44_00165 [Actinobacteria bacterium]|nr:MAG: hypothetical protein E6G44_00165 [Actinomycetota bacterium]
MAADLGDRRALGRHRRGGGDGGCRPFRGGRLRGAGPRPRPPRGPARRRVRPPGPDARRAGRAGHRRAHRHHHADLHRAVAARHRTQFRGAGPGRVLVAGSPQAARSMSGV